ncbi:hypothetical protein ABZW18_13690 [Streptomyces sp. NPDC004647]|uniref:hypothetical protein n=1 Tax=Streptomyces sp. NPDC004647 TaxID=3154671 RepID=UPI0033AF1B07
MVPLAIVSAVGMVVDERVLVGSPIWFKPLKFSVSFAVYAVALAWMLSLLTRGRRTGRWAGIAIVAAGTAEMAIITGQVLRGKRSHFNVETPFDRALFIAMGVTIVVLWTGTLLIALLLLRERLTDRAAAWAVRLGAVIAVVGLALGALMVLPTPEQRAAAGAGVQTVVGAHSVGLPDGGPSMPVTGWSTVGGDLRIPHFIGMHALQALPLFLLGLTALSTRVPRLRSERVRLRLVLVASGSYAAVLALVTWQALRGQPLIHPDAATLWALALIIAATAAASRTALRASPAAPVALPIDGKEPVS